MEIAQYTQEFDERLPLIIITPAFVPDNPATKQDESATYGWADALSSYTMNKMLFHCPTLEHPNGTPKTFAPLARDCTDYWFNGKVAGQSLKNVASPPLTLALGDGNDGGDMTDARYNYSALPAPWLSDEKAPCFRHLEGANYCFVILNQIAKNDDNINKIQSFTGKHSPTPTF